MHYKKKKKENRKSYFKTNKKQLFTAYNSIICTRRCIKYTHYK